MITQFQFLRTWLVAHADTERGASLIEYALLLALIAVVCIAAVTSLGDTVSDNYEEIGSSLD